MLLGLGDLKIGKFVPIAIGIDGFEDLICADCYGVGDLKIGKFEDLKI